MKKYMFTPVMVMLITACATLRAQNYQEEYLGLPGDNLDLYAVMKLFQESETLEGFERSLNDENSRINNLDLNGDGYVDYIRVMDNVDGNVHYIVLQVPLGPKENQDVAVFTVVRENNGHVFIQLIGDEALYGKDYIIEPIMDETPNPGYTGNTRNNVVVTHTTTVEIATWPLVRFIFMPTYVVWRSPWYYRYYPSYWQPWSPFYWHYYHGYHSHYYSYYYGHYRHWKVYRHPYYHSYYYGTRRTHSTQVAMRINEGRYKSTYSHPEQRKEGSALYMRTHSDQNSRSAGNTQGRRAVSGERTSRQVTGTSTSRQSTTTGGVRKSTSTNTNRQSSATGGTRKSTSTSTNRQSSTTSGTRQSTSTSTNRQSSSTGSVRQSTGTNTGQKQTTATTSRTSNRSNAGRVSSGSSTTKQSSGKSVSSSGRLKSESSNSSDSSGKSTRKSKKSTSSSSSGRR